MLLGETAEVEGLFVAAAMNSSGIALSAGAGRLTAEWIVDGRPSLDATKLDLRRFARLRRPSAAICACASPSCRPGCAAPPHPAASSRRRGPCCSPLHDWLAARGAVFATSAGMERPAWFGDPGDAMAAYRRERAVLESGVALIDRSGDAKLRLHGPGADAAMRRLCGVDFDAARSARFLAPMLDAAGGVQALPWHCARATAAGSCSSRPTSSAGSRAGSDAMRRTTPPGTWTTSAPITR